MDVLYAESAPITSARKNQNIYLTHALRLAQLSDFLHFLTFFLVFLPFPW